MLFDIILLTNLTVLMPVGSLFNESPAPGSLTHSSAPDVHGNPEQQNAT